MAAPSEKESVLIKKFRLRFAEILETDEQKTDHFLLRWIRAREGNLDKAEAMLRNSNVDNTLNKPLDPYIWENFPYRTLAKSKAGLPVRETHVGCWDVYKAITLGKEEAFEAWVNHFFEDIMAKIKEANDARPKGSYPITQFIYVLDWEGFSYSQLLHFKSAQSLMKFAALYEAHYPEILYRVYFVNAPAAISLFMSIFKNFVSPHTYAKVKIFGNKKEEWEAALKEEIDVDTLWKRFGGNKE